MSNQHIIRAWKDEAFRESLSPQELASIPVHPAGWVELSESELTHVMGAWPTGSCTDGCTGTRCILTALSTISCVITFSAC